MPYSKKIKLRVCLVGFLTATQLFAQAEEYTRRGTDVGNGGDPVREIFNAARIYAEKILGHLSEDVTMLDDREGTLSEKVKEKVISAKDNLIRHIRNDLHRWGNFKFSKCSSIDVSELDSILFDYRECATKISNSYLATRELLKITISKSILLSQKDTDEVTEILIRNWSTSFKKEATDAINIMLNHQGIIGKWVTLNSDVAAQIFPKGVLRLINRRGNTELRIIDFITWIPEEMRFHASGHLVCSQTTATRNLNTVTEAICRQPIKIYVTPSQDQTELEVNYSPMSGVNTCRCSYPSKSILLFPSGDQRYENH